MISPEECVKRLTIPQQNELKFIEENIDAELISCGEYSGNFIFDVDYWNSIHNENITQEDLIDTLFDRYVKLGWRLRKEKLVEYSEGFKYILSKDK